MIAGSVIALASTSCAYPAGSAALVGGAVIEQSEIADRTSALIAQAPENLNPSDVSGVNRSQATSLIRHQLIEIAARDQGVTVSEQDVNSILASQGEAALAQRFSVPAGAVRQTLQDVLLLDGLIRRVPQEGAQVTDVQVSVDGLYVASRDEAVATRSRFLRDPAGVPALVAAAGEESVQGPATLLTQPNAGRLGVFNVPAGDVVIFPTEGRYLVFRVSERTVEPALLTFDLLSAQQSPSALLDLQALVLAPYADREGVSVSPRYGTWDPLSVQVVPNDDGL